MRIRQLTGALVACHLFTACLSLPTISTPTPSATLAFVSPLTALTADKPFAVRVQVVDAAGALVDTNVSIVLRDDDVPVATVAAVNGVAEFVAVQLTRAGAHTLTASAQGYADVTSGVTIGAGPTTQLTFLSAPSGGRAGAPLAETRVALMDAYGNTTSDAASVALAATGAVPLSGTTERAAVGGVAVFDDLHIDRSGAGYTLQATAASFSATSASFDLGAGAPHHLVFVTPPSAGPFVAGAAIAATLEVRVEDIGGDVSPDAVAVTLALGSNPGMGTLSGGGSVQAAGGVATFIAPFVNRAASGYTLQASAPGVPSITTGTFAVTPAAPARLGFVDEPSAGRAGIVLSQTSVAVVDAFGNITDEAVAITLEITSGTGAAAAMLSGTTEVTTIAGVAVFTALTIDRKGNAYTLRATAPMLVEATSSAFDIAGGVAHHLAFGAEPPAGPSVAGSTLAPVTVRVEDVNGDLSPDSVDVTLALSTNPGGSTLTGGDAVAAVTGVATFSGVSLNKTGGGYVLRAQASGIASDDTSPFAITHAAASKLQVSTQPASTTAGATLSFAATILDAFNNVVTADTTTSVTAAIVTNPGSATLTGVTTRTPVAGVITFSGLSLNKIGTGYTLGVSATGLTSATSNAFNISHGSAHHLAFTTLPTSVGASTLFSVGVSIVDALGNTVTSASAVAVTIARATGPGTLTGTLTRNTAAGVAVFAGLSIDVASALYTLSASAAGPLTGTSDAFTITHGAATKLTFVQQPTTTQTGVAMSPAVTVAIRDAHDNLVDTGAIASTGITLVSLLNGATGAVAGPVAASGGIATFSDVRITYVNNADDDYYLLASGGGFASVQSNAFDITFEENRVCYVQNNHVGLSNGQSATPYATLSAAAGTPNGAPCKSVRVRRGDGSSTGLDMGFHFLDGQSLERDLAESDQGLVTITGRVTIANGNTITGPFAFTTPDDVAVYGYDTNGLTVQTGVTLTTHQGITFDGTPTGTLRLRGVSINSVYAGVLVSPGTAHLSLEDVAVATSIGDGIVFDGSTLTATGVNTVSATAGAGLRLTNATIAPSGATFASVSAQDYLFGIYLLDVKSGGPLTIQGGSLGANSTSGYGAFYTYGGSVSGTIGANISVTGEPAAVWLRHGHIGALTFTGAVAATGTNVNGGINIEAANGTYAFSGPVSMGNTTVLVAGATGACTFGAATTFTDTRFVMNDGSANVTFAGTMTGSTSNGRIDVSHQTGGKLTFSGTATLSSDSVGAVNIGNSADMDVQITGTLALQSNFNPTMSITDVNSLVMPGSNNTVTSNGGGALTMGGLAIGPSGVRFKAVNSYGGRGLNLYQLTGGAVTVANSGGAAGSMSNCSGACVVADEVAALVLDGVAINNTATEDCVVASNNGSVTVLRSTIDTCRYGIAVFSGRGNVTISSSTIENVERGVSLGTAQAPMSLTVNAPTSAMTLRNVSDMGIYLDSSNHLMTAAVTGATFEGIQNGAMVVNAFQPAGTLLSFINNTVSASATRSGGHFQLNAADGLSRVRVSGNTFAGSDPVGLTSSGQAFLRLGGFGTAQIDAYVQNNTITRAYESHGVFISVDQSAVARTLITGNSIDAGANAIRLRTGGGVGLASLDATVNGNAIVNHDFGPTNPPGFNNDGGIFVVSEGNDDSSSDGFDTVCTTFANNGIAPQGSYAKIRLYQQGSILRYEDDGSGDFTAVGTPTSVPSLTCAQPGAF